MTKVKIFYDFLPYVNDIYALSKTFDFYTQKQLEEKFGDTGQYPGTRTGDLKKHCPFLYIHILTLLQQSLRFRNKYHNITMSCNLRLEQDNSKDWIHIDSCDTALIYLSPTNLSSGTDFYDQQENTIASAKFVQGTCVFFEQGIKHCSINNHGQDVSNGRMTINVFMEK